MPTSIKTNSGVLIRCYCAAGWHILPHHSISADHTNSVGGPITFSKHPKMKHYRCSVAVRNGHLHFQSESSDPNLRGKMLPMQELPPEVVQSHSLRDKWVKSTPRIPL